MSQCYSLKSSHLLSPTLCPKVCSLCLHLYCCHVSRFINTIFLESIYMHSVQSLCCVQLFVNPWTAARQASLSFTNSQSLLKLMSIESVMPSKHLILCHPLLLLPSVLASSRVFSNKSVLCIRWLKYWSFSFSMSPSNEYSGMISFRIDWLISEQFKGFLSLL